MKNGQIANLNRQLTLRDLQYLHVLCPSPFKLVELYSDNLILILCNHNNPQVEMHHCTLHHNLYMLFCNIQPHHSRQVLLYGFIIAWRMGLLMLFLSREYYIQFADRALFIIFCACWIIQAKLFVCVIVRALSMCYLRTLHQRM